MRRGAVIAGSGTALLAFAGCAFLRPPVDLRTLPPTQSPRCQQLGQVAQEAIDVAVILNALRALSD